MEADEVSWPWQEETWDNLIPRLNRLRAGWQAILDKIRRDFDDEAVSEYEANLQPVIDTFLWLVPAAEAMCARQELRVFTPVLDHHTTISLLWQNVHVGVTPKANNHYEVWYFDCRKFGTRDVTHLGEGDAEQTAACVAAFVRQYAE